MLPHPASTVLLLRDGQTVKLSEGRQWSARYVSSMGPLVLLSHDGQTDKLDKSRQSSARYVSSAGPLYTVEGVIWFVDKLNPRDGLQKRVIFAENFVF